ncbi:PAS domain S-box-containing protein [Prosthecobacter fusiformis]|uniref:histidine kinase n=1 Tax=Prosthecobacter fusiformis TaxID=48464 RepID=A0A4R7RWG9_9BACT|nr:ATP-binding protein [Prosthecobacter fusiformis]TDU69306.1 PAS domain S-box-containing protein [Prosthecobacter fusiformis]
MSKKASSAHSPASRKSSGTKSGGNGARTGTQVSKKAEAKPRVWIDKSDFERIHDHLREAQETLDAIRNGDVDAVVVSGSHGSQVYSLSGAEQPYRIYVEQMQEGAVTVDQSGLILYCNQRFADMTGLPLERVISSQILQYVPKSTWKNLDHVFKGEEAAKHECLLQHLDGGSRPVLLTGSPLPMEDQHVMCLVVTDLTEQKEREELRQGKEGAEKANLAKDAFLAALSHELRTPLTPALMATMALENDESLPESVRASLGMIRRNVELEARLIDDLLDLTRIARGKLELHLRAVDVHVIIQRAHEICETDIHTKKQTFELQLNAAKHLAMADPVRLQQALWNVIRNAVKFTPEGGIITVKTGNRGKKIWIEVTDSGIGFAQKILPGMFKPFEQGGRDITRRFGGLGLGLAISSSIMESHDGTIIGDSPGADKGATFTLELPLGSLSSPVNAGPVEFEKDLSHSGLRILLVEDHKDTRASMELLLRRAGHVVTAADCAAMALEIAEAHTFDLVISDLGLPDLSGMELMSQLRDQHGLRGIAVSGYGMEEDILRSKDAGFVYHLTKPIQMETLRRLIRQFAASGG